MSTMPAAGQNITTKVIADICLQLDRMVVTADTAASYADFGVWGDVCGRAPHLDHHSELFFDDSAHFAEVVLSHGSVHAYAMEIG